jgi:hypothetical protein
MPITIKNSYPEKPVEIFQRGSAEMGAIIDKIKALDFPIEVKRTAYVIARNETGNGKSIIAGTNPCGAQADSGRWPAKWDSAIKATCVKKENGTQRERRFLIFNTLENGLAFLCERIVSKGIFMGEQVNGRFHKGEIKTPEQLADAYQDEWVKGADVKPTPAESANFVSMYKQAKVVFA